MPDDTETQWESRRSAPGVRLLSDKEHTLLQELRTSLHDRFRPKAQSLSWAAPVIDRAIVERAQYPDMFGDLVADVVPRGTAQLGALMLPPAMCHHIFGELADRALHVSPSYFIVEGSCFRNEGNEQAGRLRSYEVSEHLFIGPRDEVQRWLADMTQEAADWIRGLGLAIEIEVAHDPFTGPIAPYLTKLQVRSAQKTEASLISSVLPKMSVASFNAHADHFSKLFAIKSPDGSDGLHSACVGFGLNRLVLALKHSRVNLD